MHIAKYYSEKYKLAYVVLGHCKDFGQRADEIELFEMETGLKLPPKIELNEIAIGKWHDMTIVKFHLEAKSKLRWPDREPPWLPLEEHISDLRPKYQ